MELREILISFQWGGDCAWFIIRKRCCLCCAYIRREYIINIRLSQSYDGVGCETNKTDKSNNPLQSIGSRFKGLAEVINEPFISASLSQIFISKPMT